jgi:hypothetical protein
MFLSNHSRGFAEIWYSNSTLELEITDFWHVALMMEAEKSSETPVNLYQTTRLNIPGAISTLVAVIT